MRHQKHSAESLGGGSQAKACNAAVANQHGLRCYGHTKGCHCHYCLLRRIGGNQAVTEKTTKKIHGKARTNGKMRPKACQRHFSVDNHRISHPRPFYLSILKRQGSSRLEQVNFMNTLSHRVSNLSIPFPCLAIPISVRARSVSKWELTLIKSSSVI